MEQTNSKEAPEWKAWEQPTENQRSIPSLKGAVAARKQGKQAFERFHLAMLNARHKDRIALNEREIIMGIARESQLDMVKFAKDFDDPGTTRTVIEDHEQAVGEFGVFGTPTFVFHDGHAAFFKTLLPPEGDEVGVYRGFMNLIGRYPYIGEIKHPQPPWPKGVKN